MGTANPDTVKEIVRKLTGANRRILLLGRRGADKESLAAELGRTYSYTERGCWLIVADPGSPSFGVPGSVCLTQWHVDGWRLHTLEALCSLDAGRFRLPLILAVRRLAAVVPSQALLLMEAPAMLRSVAGAELLRGLVEAAAIDTVLAPASGIDKRPVVQELATIGCEVIYLPTLTDTGLKNKRQRALHRTRLWDAYLAGSELKTMPFPTELLTGTPPPPSEYWQLQGRQIALLKKDQTLAMGEVVSVQEDTMQLRIATVAETPDRFLVRDCYRNEEDLLTTFNPVGRNVHRLPPPDAAPHEVTGKDTGRRPLVRLGDTTAILLNGVFGDPLLHLRLSNRKRSLLFDLGEGSRLPARLAHQVTDIFISHGHFDHLSGFLWLLRSRIGVLSSCRLFGPPELAERIEHLIDGIHWDRIGDKGPRFEVSEFHGEHILEYALQAGSNGKQFIVRKPCPGGLLIDDADCRVLAVSLSHGAIPSIAYRLELPTQINVLRERLRDRGLAAGPWLGELKKRTAAGERKACIELPDGTRKKAGPLADDLLRLTPGRVLVYATDLSDTAANLEKLISLAHRAHVFFCEAAFVEEDRSSAEASGHLTALACGEIARAAEAETLIPFHFSRRYEKKSHQIYDEVARACRPVRLER